MATLSGMIVDVAKPVYDYNWLCNMMQMRKVVEIVGPNGISYRGVINGIMPEDGSGNNWLLTISNDCKTSTVFVKAM